MALSDPRARLRGRDGKLLPERRWCLRCGALITAYAAESDRFCGVCAPLVEDEPPLDPALYCRRGHLKADFWQTVNDSSRASGVKGRCSECKRLDDAKRDRSVAAIEARQLERRVAA